MPSKCEVFISVKTAMETQKPRPSSLLSISNSRQHTHPVQLLALRELPDVPSQRQ